MSPEQAQGKAADRRSDIWAFGCVLYEMLAATRAFPGENVAETIANVLKSDPDWSRLPSATPLPVRRLLRRCLEKDQRRRLSDIADARLELDDAINAVPGSEVRSPVAERRSRRAWAGAALLSVVATAALVWIAFRTPPGAPEMRLEITTPPIAEPQSLAISPDGRQIVFAALSEGRTQLWLRPIDGVAARPVERTDGAAAPFWSPNGRSLAFFADAQLKRLDLDTGTVRRLADVRVTSGGSWNRDGVVLFSPDLGAPMFRVSASGGTPEAVTTLSRDVRAGGGHRLPEFLPDGRHFLFHVRESGSAGEIWVGDLEGTAPRRLLDVDRSDTGAAYAPSGHLLFIRDATLFAQPFDPVRLQLTGEPVVVAEGVSAVKTGVAPGSPIVYRTGRSGPLQRQLVWFERSGKVIAPLGDPYAANSGVPAMSPDGRQVAVSQAVSGSASDLWLLDATRGLFTRFTNDPFINNFPLWSPDGRHIVFQTNAKGFLDLYQKPVVGTSPPELVVATTQSKSPNDWSADGRWLLYRSLDPANGWDLWALPMEGDRKPVPVVQTSFSERDGQFSPDGRWIAYQSDESGRDEIYIQPFPASGRKVRISTAGGTQVRWRADGRELFYLTLDEELMAAPIQFAQDRAPEPGEPVALFKVRVGGAVQRIGYSAIELSRQQYMVSRDGQRFLVNTVTEEATTSPITVVLNWAAAPAK
jgi:Tol biopolymer transport system component